MQDGHIPKDLLYGELAPGRRANGRPRLRFLDVVKRDIKAIVLNTESWKNLAADRSKWTGALSLQLKAEEKLVNAAAEKRSTQKGTQ